MSQGKKNKKRRGRKEAAAAKPDASKAPPRGKPKRRTEQRWVDNDRIVEHRAAQRRRTVIYRSLIALVILLLAGTVGWVVYRSQLPSGLPDHEAKPPATYAVPDGATLAGVPVGRPDAPVTVDLYLDFECPACRDYERATAEYFAAKVDEGTVKVVYHPISIRSGYSVWAASAAGCAAEQDAFARFTTEVFAQSGQLDREELVAVGENVDLTSPEFAQCVRDSTYQNWALGVTAETDVRRTPTVVVNGEDIEPRGSLETFADDTERAIADAAAAARTSQPEQ